MIERILSKQIKDSKKSVLLLGPRQTGKTTLLQAMQPDLQINLAKEREFQTHLNDPGYIEDLVELEKPKTVLVDEVQRLPSILNTIQALIDEKKIQFYLTGSSARKLKRGHANLLPGRLVNKRCFPLTIQELSNSFGDTELLKFGFLPGIVTNSNVTEKKEVLLSYVANYLREEIQQESLTRNLQGYSKFIHNLPEHSGKLLDYSKMSLKNKLNRFAVHRFFEILEDTLIGQRIYSSDILDHLIKSKHPKFYFFDHGIFNALIGNFNPRLDQLGICHETIIYNQLTAQLTYAGIDHSLTYFRTHSGIEVDFILKIPDETYAIEVKSTDRLTTDDVKHLKWLHNEDKKIKPLLIHFGEKNFKVDQIWCLNWKRALEDFQNWRGF